MCAPSAIGSELIQLAPDDKVYDYLPQEFECTPKDKLAIEYARNSAERKVFLPINIDNQHWYLAVINAKKRKIQVLDSLCWTHSRDDLQTTEDFENVSHSTATEAAMERLDCVRAAKRAKKDQQNMKMRYDTLVFLVFLVSLAQFTRGDKFKSPVAAGDWGKSLDCWVGVDYDISSWDPPASVDR
ncbi:hypothetical protein EJB05_14648, partial [Eragrostis curvula]